MTSEDAFHDTQEANVPHLGLALLSPDPLRAEHVRAKCRARLVRNRIHAARATRRRGFARRVLAPAIAGGFCLLYIVALVATTLRLYAADRHF